MSAIREAKPVIYYLIRRGWYDQLLRLCDGIIKKGKDPVTMFWKAFAHGMSGDIVGSIAQLESFSSGRKDMQYPISLALKYFRSRMANPDQDAIDQLNSEIAVAEDVTVRFPGCLRHPCNAHLTRSTSPFSLSPLPRSPSPHPIDQILFGATAN